MQESSATSTNLQESSSATTSTTVNAGQRALDEMRRQRAEQKDAELRKVRKMLQADEQLSSTPAAIPGKVAMRMGKRMLPFVGLPLNSSQLLLQFLLLRSWCLVCW